MAKPATILIKLVSTANTGFYYVTKKNPRTATEKLEFRKYDPVARKHVLFKEARIKEVCCGRAYYIGLLSRTLLTISRRSLADTGLRR